VQLLPYSCYLIPLWSKYSPRVPVLKHPQSVLFPYKTTGRIMVLYTLTFYIPRQQAGDDKRLWTEW
jgi:hypothetical protein